jgi:hypothetical protein
LWIFQKESVHFQLELGQMARQGQGIEFDPKPSGLTAFPALSIEHGSKHQIAQLVAVVCRLPEPLKF